MKVKVNIKRFASGNCAYRRADNNALLGYIYRKADNDYFVREVWNGNVCRRATLKSARTADKSLRQMITSLIHDAGNDVVFEDSSP